MNEIPLDRKTKEELLELVKATQKEFSRIINVSLSERDKLRKEVRDLTLKNRCHEAFETRIKKELDKLIKDLA